MCRLLSFLKRLHAEQRGATALEYGLILALVVLAMFGALKTTAGSTIAIWNQINTKVAAH